MMEKDELKHYQELTKFQKESVDALSMLGYKHKHFNTYFKLGCLDIDVSKFNSLSELLYMIHEQGKTHKMFEIQLMLGITHNY